MATAKIEKNDGKTLADALIAFQADLPDIGLDSENPHFKSKFASLPKITKVVLPKLAENGLSFTAGGVIQEGQFGLSASLLHESGEERSGFFPITATDPQKIGSAITYARRYLLASLTGIVADADDDGNAASAVNSPAARQLDQARNAPAPSNTAGSLNDLNAKIREYIGGDEAKKKAVNARLEALEGTPVKKREALIKELGIE